MFDFEKMESIEQFEELKQGDQIIVRWSDDFAKNRRCEKVMTYSIADVVQRCHEVTCRVKGKHFFNYRMYLGLEGPTGRNTSNALEVHRIRT